MSNTRVITAFSTRGKNKKKIETDVQTWGDLKPLLENEGFKLSSLAATESVNRTDLAHKDAALPEGDFTIFLRPTKTKSGADYASMSFRELRNLLSQEDKDALTEIYNRNWTRVSTDQLREYFTNKGSSTTGQDETCEADCSSTNSSRFQRVTTLLAEIKENSSSDDVIERVEVIEDELDGLSDAIEEEKSPEAIAERKAQEEAAQADAEETDALADEADDLMSGF